MAGERGGVDDGLLMFDNGGRPERLWPAAECDRPGVSKSSSIDDMVYSPISDNLSIQFFCKKSKN
jgi:hypothetical protein